VASLKLYCLGGINFVQDDLPLTNLKSRKGQALVCYLAVTGKRYTRSALAGLLWADMPEHNALTNLRKTLQRIKPLTQFLTITRDTLAFNQTEQVRLDVKEFEAAAANRSDIRRLRYAVSLYKGDFLEGWDSDDLPLFNDWVLSWRARLHETAIFSLQALTNHFTNEQDFPSAIPYARQLLSIEPWHEETHRELMRLLALTDHRSEALIQFEKCKHILEMELGVKPAPATVQLYERIKNGEQERYRPGTPSTNALPLPANLPNLPAQTTPLIGRLNELVKIKAFLEDPQIQLISIVGMGGMGKTHLALALAHEMAAEEQFADGVYFVSLGNASTRLDLIITLADHLHLSLAGTREPAVNLLHDLQGKQNLIVLDGVEPLLSEVDFLMQILAVAPNSKLLLTSRERIKLKEEWVLDLYGLSYPSTAFDVQATGADAVRLFTQRAQQIRSNFSLENNLEAVVRICQLTQGMPLALELAASWIRTLTATQIADQIAHNLRFLSTDLHSIPERHRSMRAVFDSSWQMMSTTEQEVMSKLSVFRDGFTLEAARQVSGASLPILAGLVDHSFLTRIPGVQETARYAMHDLIHQYASDRLHETDHPESTQDKHLAYFLAFAEQAEQFWDTAQEKEWLGRLVTERANFYAALRWALDQELVEVTLRLNAALFTFWIYTSSRSDAQDWLEASLALPWDEGSSRTLAARAKLLNVAGYSATNIFSLELALSYFEQGLALYMRLEDQRGIAWSLRGCGFVEMIRGNYSQARPHLEQSLAICQSAQDEWGLDWTTYDLGYLELAKGSLNEAHPLLENALDRFRQHSIRFGVYRALIALGDVERAKSLHASAPRSYSSAAYYREALIMAQHNHFAIFIVQVLEGLAYTAIAEGKYLFAARLLGKAQARQDSVEPPRFGYHLAEYQQNLSRLHEQLPEAAFKAAWQEGQAMSLDQIITYALSGLPQLATQS
jgi:predicted ATPase/DNA-binding SARP family transcriptional activator